MHTDPTEDVLDALAECRGGLARLLAAVDALHSDDDVVRALARSPLSAELHAAMRRAVGVLDATSC